MMERGIYAHTVVTYMDPVSDLQTIPINRQRDV
jgi:hypothetical protein